MQQNRMMTLRGYARHRGCSLAAVQQARADGRIEVGPDGLIDPVPADAAWEANTRHEMVPHSIGEKAEDETRAEALRRRAIVEADTKELEFERKAGRLALASAVRLHLSTAVTESRNRFLGLPHRLKSRLPHLSVGDLKVIDDEVRAILDDLADGVGRIPNNAVEAAKHE